MTEREPVTTVHKRSIRMRPIREMSRAELAEELTYLRELAYGDQGDVQIQDLRERLKITPHEARLLLMLRSARGEPVRRWLLEENLPLRKGHERKTATKTVFVYVSRLRARFGRDIIETVGDEAILRGYRLTSAGFALVG
jgi:DNA-binding response OmpR family regulator